MDPAFLLQEEVLEIHREQIERYGGATGLRDPAVLASALAQPECTFEGAYLHSTIPEMASAYPFHICRNHPFVDGNKRTAANAAITFLLLNGWVPLFEPDEYAELVLAVAGGEITKAKLASAFAARCRVSDAAPPLPLPTGSPS